MCVLQPKDNIFCGHKTLLDLLTTTTEKEAVVVAALECNQLTFALTMTTMHGYKNTNNHALLPKNTQRLPQSMHVSNIKNGISYYSPSPCWYFVDFIILWLTQY